MASHDQRRHRQTRRPSLAHRKRSGRGHGEIMDGAATPAQIAAYLMGLRLKGETVEEIAGSVRAMRERADRIGVGDPMVVDTCGTGGDCAPYVQHFVDAAFVVAGAGLTVAKHGNRSVSSKCGSADVLSALGVNIRSSRRARRRLCE